MVVVIPDNLYYGSTAAERKFKRAVVALILEGAYPGPQRLNRLVHGHSCRNINGRECRWRREICHQIRFPLHGFNWGDRPGFIW